MKLFKTSEKLLVWMHRTGITQQKIADEIGITRQTLSKKMESNLFDTKDLITFKRLGFKDE